MSQSSTYNNGGGGGGGVITINGDTGSATGATITFDALTFAGSSVSFNASVSSVDFEVSDANGNTLIGFNAGNGTLSGINNISLGGTTLHALTTGSSNTAIGYHSLEFLTTGASNSGLGSGSLTALTTGGHNTSVGFYSLDQLVTGSYNTSLGDSAGYNYTGAESSNINVGYNTSGTLGESNVLRIGNGTGAGNGQVNKAFISGINGITSAAADQVLVINSSNQVGSIASGASGYLLASQGAGANPHWIAPSAVSGIVTIDGNSGSATGATVTVKVNQASLPAYTGGSTVNFYASGATNQLSFTDDLDNTGVGYNSLASLAGAGGSNTAFGFETLNSVSSGDNNTGIGTAAGNAITTGSSNTFVGYEAGLVATSGDANTLIGVSCANRLTTGQYNIILGSATNGSLPFNSAAGYNYTSSESSNLVIGNLGVTGESHVIRIGTSGSSNGQQNKCYVAGIDGVNVGSVAKVLTMASDQLGTATITAGTGITITPTANTITIDSSGIITIDGDTGSVTGSTISINGTLAAGSTVSFFGAGTTLLFEVTDIKLNTIIGNNAGNGTISGTDNTSLGHSTLLSLTSGIQNVALGNSSLLNNLTGNNNIALGYSSMLSTTAGSGNIVIGGGGSNSSDLGSNNIIIGNPSAVPGTISNQTVIGNDTTAEVFISGIEGVNVGSVATVVTMDTNQLGTATITGGTGITVTPTANTITITASGSGITWHDVTTGSATLAASSGYIADKNTLTTFTLPTNSAFGDTIQIVGKGSGGWTIVYGTSQFINFGADVTTPTSGSLSSTDPNDCLTLVCTSASLTAPIFTVTSSIGNITVV